MRFKIERVGGAKAMLNVSQICGNCTAEAKCRKRDFSIEAWTVLVLWNEVQAASVDEPLCDECYNELRETLIDRAADVAAALNEVPKIKPQPKVAAAASRSRVRKAG